MRYFVNYLHPSLPRDQLFMFADSFDFNNYGYTEITKEQYDTILDLVKKYTNKVPIEQPENSGDETKQ